MWVGGSDLIACTKCRARMNDIHFRFASTVFAALPFATHTGRQPKDSARIKLGLGGKWQLTDPGINKANME
ncbi:hypothetical protein M5D96_004772, partial [Drosophila gunungcola]